MRSFFELISRRAADTELVADEVALSELDKPLELMAARGNACCDLQKRIDGVVYKLDENPMGISEVSFAFDNGNAQMRYTNAQGKKTVSFGMLENVYEDAFPQEGYSKEIGGERTTGHYYRYAASGAWTRENELHIKIQIIDDYFGRLDIRALFLDDTKLCLRMQKTAEDFLNEYNGTAYGKC